MKTNWQDPGSTEILSSHISGLQEAVGKIEDAIGLQTVAETDIPLTEVYISDTDRYRIYQAPIGKRNWVASPAPVIKKNGVVISSDFTIDYGGGAIILSPAASGSDTFTADVTRVNSTHSITPASIGAETPAGAQAKADAAESDAKAYTDAHIAATSAHSATSAATANRIMMRDDNGRAKVAAPSAADDIARKDTVDAVQTNLTNHSNLATSAHGGIVPSSDVVTSAAANKILKLNDSAKLPASITGDADTVDGAHAGTGANNVLKLDSSGLVPIGNIPTNLTGKNADQVDGYHAGNGANNVLKLDVSGLVPLANIPSSLTGKNADTVDGLHVTGSGTAGLRKITLSTADPSGGSDGDVWIKYIP